LLWKGKLNRKHSNHLIHFGIPLFSLLLCGCTPASLMPGLLSLVAPVALALLAIPVVIALSKSGKIKLNIWTPFRFYIGRIHPTTHVAQHPFHEHLGKTANARLSCRHAWDIKSIGLVARLRCIRSRAVVGAQPVQRGGPAPAPPPQKLWEHGFEAQRADD
jgi:hypothetical protein